MTDNIKLPPLPVSANFYGMYGEYTKSQVEALMREAVRLNAQAVPDGMVLVDSVALNTAISALRRDAKEGRPLRGKWAAALSAAPAAPAAPPPEPPQAVLDAQEKALLQAIQERDAADDYIDALLDEVLGTDRPEWSSVYGHADAIEQVREMMNTLMKPSIDKAWDRFQSSVAPAAPQPAQQEDDESDALTVAYLHGHGKGKDSVQPLLAEKDALLRQALEALGLPCDRWNAVQYRIVHAAIKAIRNHLGVKND